jgi:hypothetical protein
VEARFYPSAGQVAGGSATSNGSSVIAGATAAASGVNITGSTNVNGAALNTVVNLDNSGAKTGSSSMFSFNFLAASLKKWQDEKKLKTENEQASQIGAGYAAAASAKTSQEISSGYASAAAATDAYVAKGATVYETGSSTPVAQPNSVLSQTAYAGTVVTPSSAVAASEAANFVDNGNQQKVQPALSYAGNNLGNSTNPQPGPVII